MCVKMAEIVHIADKKIHKLGLLTTNFKNCELLHI